MTYTYCSEHLYMRTSVSDLRSLVSTYRSLEEGSDQTAQIPNQFGAWLLSDHDNVISTYVTELSQDHFYSSYLGGCASSAKKRKWTSRLCVHDSRMLCKEKTWVVHLFILFPTWSLMFEWHFVLTLSSPSRTFDGHVHSCYPRVWDESFDWKHWHLPCMYQ